MPGTFSKKVIKGNLPYIGYKLWISAIKKPVKILQNRKIITVKLTRKYAIAFGGEYVGLMMRNDL